MKRGYLPSTFSNYRQNLHAAFDIETLEKRNERHNDDLVIGTFEEAVLRPVSIGCSNNINGDDKFFLRQSSHSDDAPALTHEFLDYLFELVGEYHDALPGEISQAIQKLTAEIATEKFSKAKTEKNALMSTLKQFKTLVTYGFNSGMYKFSFLHSIFQYFYLGKFDIPCLITYFASYCQENEVKINILKKTASYFTLELIKDEKLPTEKRISFRDVRNYCPPCGLDKFLRTWEAPFSKSIFPYQRYSSVEELAQATEFPSKEAFFNSLKQVIFKLLFCQVLQSNILEGHQRRDL